MDGAIFYEKLPARLRYTLASDGIAPEFVANIELFDQYNQIKITLKNGSVILICGNFASLKSLVE